MDILDITTHGHFTKAFDADRAIPAEVMEQLLAFLHSSASSVNVQPWRFIVLSTPEAKQQVAATFTGGAVMNLHKVRDASHVIIFSTMTALSDEYLDRVHAQEVADGRFATPELSEQWRSVVRGWIDLHRYDVKDLNHWMEKQTYLAAGALLVAAANLSVDVTPIEGFDSRAIDALFGLREKGLTTTLIMSLGYRNHARDFAVTLPKSRLPREELFTFL